MNRREFLSNAAGAAGAAFSIPAGAAGEPCNPAAIFIDGNAFQSPGCIPTGDAGDIPAYMSGLPSFGVRSLTGSISPSNGKEVMFLCLPTEWQRTGQPHGADNVFAAWSGGAGDAANRRLYVHGGGHYDSANNGLFIFDFSGNDRPTGWSVAPNSLSTIAGTLACSDPYPDGRPPSIHTYDHLFYEPRRARFYRFGGSPFCGNGAGTSSMYFYDFSMGAWVPWGTSPRLGASLGGSLVAANDGSKLLFLSGDRPSFFKVAATGEEIPYGSSLFGSQEAQPSAAYDSTRNKWVLFHGGGSTPRVRVVTVNWSASTWSDEVRQLSGAAAQELNAPGACVFYDQLRDSFWVFGNRNAGASIAYIYEVSASDFSVSRFSLASSIPVLSQSAGGYNRFVWFPNWRIVGTVHAHDRPVSLIRIPS